MRTFIKASLAALLTVFAILGFTVPRAWRPGAAAQDHEGVFGKDGLLTATADKLKATVVTPHLARPIKAGKNVLWCGTFQLAWNEACALIGEDIHLTKDPPMVAVLNKKAFKKADLDDGSYVALAGFIRDDILEKIPKALNEKFKGQARPQLIPKRRGLRPQDFVAYCYLFKNLEFPKPFERLDSPIVFGKTKLKCFGMEEFKPGHRPLYGQVDILDYKSPDDFVIELKSKSKDDRIILAKLKPEADLRKTIAGVEQRIKKKPAAMGPGDILKVPKLNFDVTREYAELYGANLVVKNPKVAKDIQILRAIQNIRFQMDEKGVKLRSESTIVFGCSAQPQHMPTYTMIFDKPFLILMQRRGAKAPYFALWVDNPELLVKE